MNNTKNDKNSYCCRVKNDCSNEFLHPVFTFILGTIINFRHLIYLGLWYIVIFTPVLSVPMDSLPIWLGTIIAILMLSFNIYCICFSIIPGIYRNIKSWAVIFKARGRLPLMTIGYSKAKTLIGNLDKFTCGEIYINRITPYNDYCWDNSYYGVDEFLGLYQDKHTAFKGSIFSTVLINYSISIANLKENILNVLEKYTIFSKSKKEKKYSFKKELAKNEERAINSLLKEIEKKKKLSNEQINQAVDEMKNTFKD